MRDSSEEEEVSCERQLQQQLLVDEHLTLLISAVPLHEQNDEEVEAQAGKEEDHGQEEHDRGARGHTRGGRQ